VWLLKKTIVGYENGLIIIINEADIISRVVDILNKELQQRSKKNQSFSRA
jgi:S-adenosylmethionine hydrolase